LIPFLANLQLLFYLGSNKRTNEKKFVPFLGLNQVLFQFERVIDLLFVDKVDIL
jgi:hypothetical protein